MADVTGGTDSASLAPLLDALAGARVACVGDVMLDRFVYGDVARVSPEAPIPVCRVRDETAMLGGAGNVVRNLVALNAGVEFAGVVGDDDVAQDVALLLRDLSGVSPTLLTDPRRPTTSKIRYVAGGQQLLRADREITAPIPDTLGASLSEAVSKALESVHVLVISDYGKGAITDQVAQSVIAAARSKNKPVIVDPKSRDFRRYSGASLVTPNLKEFGEAAGGNPANEDDIVAAARRLLSDSGIAAMLITRGPQGMSIVTGEGASHFSSRAREVFDVSGAGDTVVATLAAAIAGGADLMDAALLANVAAGIVVGKSGTAVVYLDDLSTELESRGSDQSSDALLSSEPALDRIRSWRDRGEKIGFTNGCFDLLHPGHVSLLSQAKSACDRLVVGLNADSSVKKLKGDTRPVQNENARAAVLGSLETVDMVIIFEEDTPEELLRQVKPDVLVKGADYTIDTVVGADFVQSYGGKVILAELVQGFSTTATIARMNAS